MSSKTSKETNERTNERAGKETLGFQAEVKQLLHLMIHSLYSNKEIFLRELISNAADAADKLRFEALSDDTLLKGDPDLAIRISYDQDAATVTVEDNGIGMSRDEIVAHLGTIARSGTAEFLHDLTGDQRKDAKLIGQFGVGFYSSFIVASKVEVFTRRAGADATQGVHWESGGDGEFSVEDFVKADRGTRVLLHLREDDKEFADSARLRTLVRKYSDHIAIPVEMRKQDPEASDDKERDAGKDEWEAVNSATALWTRPQKELTDDEYKAFYKHTAHDFADPLCWSHNKVEGSREYTSLLYIPARPPFDLWNRDAPRGLKLYIQRVFIMDDAEQFLPLYLRFVRGVVDSNDLPLNISRELLQRDAAVDAMRGALTRRALDMLGKLAKKQPEDYARAWQAFGAVLKEGPAEDPGNRERIADLLRFATTHTGKPEQDQSLADYVSRMQEGQDKIYFLTAQSHKAASDSPHLEVFRARGIEVLLLSDRIDEWVTAHLSEYKEYALRDVTRGELKLPGAEEKAEEEPAAESDETQKKLIERLTAALGDQVNEVRTTRRLTESPACLVVGDHELGLQMRDILKAAGQAVPDSAPSLEINPDHALIKRLDNESDDRRFEDLALVLFGQACLAEGRKLDDPGAYVKRMNRLLTEAATT